MTTLYISQIRPALIRCSPLRNLGYLGDPSKGAGLNVAGLENLQYATTLKTLEFFSIECRLLREDAIKPRGLVKIREPNISMSRVANLVIPMQRMTNPNVFM